MGRYLELARKVAQKAPATPYDINDINDKSPSSSGLVTPERDTNVPDVWSQGFLQLDPFCAPRDVPRPHWLRFIGDFRDFLQSGWAEKAHALGWSSLDLFGCHPTRPYARLDQKGLLWLLQGRPIVALTDTIAMIDVGRDDHHSFNRQLVRDEAVLAWEV